MKNAIRIISMFLSMGQLIRAQITITEADMPKIGEQYIYNTIDGTTGEGPAGANVNWDFSTLLNSNPLVVIDTVNIYSRDTIAASVDTGHVTNWITNTYGTSATDTSWFNGKSFHTASFGTGGKIKASGTYRDYEVSDGVLKKWGEICQDCNLFGIGCRWNGEEAQKIMTFPSTYQSVVTQEFLFFHGCSSIDVGNYSAVRTYGRMDGFGELSVPNNNFYWSVLRQKLTEYVADTSYVNVLKFGSPIDTIITYKWWAQGFGLPVLEIKSNYIPVYTGNVVTGYSGGYVRWLNKLGSYKNIIQSVSDRNTNFSVKLYPNPSTGIIKIEMAQADVDGYLIQVYNAMGQMMYSRDVNTPACTLDLSNLANGVYSYRLINKAAVAGFGRIVIEK